MVQAPEVIRKIEAFLTWLYARRLRRLELEIALVPPAALDHALCGVPVGTCFGEEVFDSAIRVAGEKAISWRTTAAEGETLVLRPALRRSSVKDYDLYQTGVYPVLNCFVGVHSSGPRLWVRAAPTPRSGVYLLNFKIAWSHVANRGAIRDTPYGELELPQVAGFVLAGATVVRADETYLLGELRLPEEEPASFAVLARLRRVPAAGVALPFPAVFEVGAFLWDRPQVLLGRDFGMSGEYEDLELFEKESRSFRLYSPEALLQEVRKALPKRIRKDRRLRLCIAGSALFAGIYGDPNSTGNIKKIIRNFLCKKFAEKYRVVTASLWWGTAAPELLDRARDPQGGKTLLVAGWRDVLELEHAVVARFRGLVGCSGDLWAGEGRRFVADIEQVSGGSKSFVVEMPDPVVRWGGSGVELGFAVRAPLGTSCVQIWVRGTVARTVFGNSVKVRVDRRVKPGEGGKPAPQGPEMTIDLPDQTVDRWRHVVTVPAGRACLLSAAPDPSEPGKVKVLVIEAGTEKPW